MMQSNAENLGGVPTEPPARPAVVARAGRYYRNARYIMALMFLGFGLWCVRDGFFTWPKANAAAYYKAKNIPMPATLPSAMEIVHLAEKENIRLPHAGWDVPFNRVLGILLPVAAVLVVVWTLYNSRGEYRLEGDTLSVPGHPPVRLEYIRKIDKRLWDRKGIAYIEYELPDGRTGRLKLDDFVYRRDPTDEILRQVETHLVGGETPP